MTTQRMTTQLYLQILVGDCHCFQNIECTSVLFLDIHKLIFLFVYKHPVDAAVETCVPVG